MSAPVSDELARVRARYVEAGREWGHPRYITEYVEALKADAARLQRELDAIVPDPTFVDFNLMLFVRAITDLEAEVERLKARSPDPDDVLAVCRVAEYAAKRWGTKPDELVDLKVLLERIRKALGVKP